MSTSLEFKMGGEIYSFGILDQFIYEESINSSATFLIRGRMASEGWDVFDEFIHNPDSDSKLRWVKGSGNDIEKGEWRSVVCARSRIGYDKREKSMTYLIEGFDQGYRLQESVTSKVYKDYRVSEIISKVASTNNLSSEVVTTQGEYHILQRGKSDGKFIVEDLIPRAYNGSSNSFIFYFRNGEKLVFEPLESQDIYKTYTDIELGISRTWVAKYMQNLKVEYRAFDPYKREMYTHEVDDNSAGYTQLSGNKVFPPSGLPEVHVLGNRTDKEKFKNLAKTKWLNDYIYMHEFLLPVRDPGLKINKLARIEVTDMAGSKMKYSGKYVITKNRVEIQKDRFVNHIYGSRRG